MQRKLTAILAADVVGYSGLMEADETGTLERLKANRGRIFDPAVAEHGGRLVKLMGDGALVEFASAVAAVACALAIQAATAKAEPEGSRRPIRYRIGVNLGDVIVDGDDLYGDGVNVAARLQTIAPIGGISVSATVRDHVAGKLECRFEEMGERTLKNIEKPVRVFAVQAPEAAASAETPSQLHAGRPAVCVLPFSNMSGEQEQEYFSDGITEDIITDLSKVSVLFVISRNSAFAFKGRQIDIPTVARQLKVSHVLEGSVRKAGNRVRITAQLIDAASNAHLWAERYDRDLNDIFALQDEISAAIVAALKVKLMPEEKKAIERRGTTNLDAYNIYLMARQYYLAGNLGGARRGETIVRLCAHATSLDPSYAQAWALMAVVQTNMRNFYGSRGEDGLAAAERALALDPNLPEAHAARAEALTGRGDKDTARDEIATALRLGPEVHEVNAIAARLAFGDRRIDDAIRHWEKASTLSAADVSSNVMLITCYTAVGRTDDARRAARRTLDVAESVVAQEPDNGAVMGYAVVALAVLGEKERALNWASRAMVIEPDNLNMKYNFFCAFVTYLKDFDAALEIAGPLFAQITPQLLDWSKVDTDLDAIRGDARYAALVETVQARLAGEAS